MLKNVSKKVLSLVIAVLLVCATPMFLAACGNKKVDAFVIASDVMDGLFNPFFATNANDSTMVGMTQLSMLTSDKNGEVAYGDDLPVVVKDMNQCPIDNRTDAQKAQAARPGFEPTAEYYENYYTTYEFVLKNGVQFSDGHPLTMEDVLFNMYVLLDPAYSGSNTMYSTDIRGMKAYRSQNADWAEQNAFDSYFNNQVNGLISQITNFCDNYKDLSADEDKYKDYIKTTRTLFKEEVQADWNAAAGMKNDYPNYPELKEQWQIFLVLYGQITLEEKKVSGKDTEYNIIWHGWDNPAANNLGSTAEADLIKYAYENKVGEDKKFYAGECSQGEYERYYKAIGEILRYWATAQSARDAFLVDIKSAYYDDIREENGGLLIPNISGITWEKDKTNYTFAHKEGDTPKTFSNSEKHQILKIVINGADPKAIWNFGFSVTPKHIYSKEDFDYDKNKFGVVAGSRDFMNKLKEVTVPVGAGAYKAKGATTDKGVFYNNNQVYFERNDKFIMGVPKIEYITYKVVDADRKLEVVDKGEVHYADPTSKPSVTNQINGMSHIKRYDIANLGYGYIGVNASKIRDINIRRAIMTSMNTSLVTSNYYADTAEIIYYPVSKVSWAYPNIKDADKGIYTSVSGGNSTIYDSGNHKYRYGSKDAAVSEITRLVEDEAGYKKDKDGNYYKNVNGTNQYLKYEFTVPGATKDHPAMDIFTNAQDLLNGMGFQITVNTRADALSKLTTGELAVWAAAWGSTIDPDMYQVYHKDSQATSVNSWGYSYLTSDDASTEERNLLNQLSDHIEKARTFLEPDQRKPYYKLALERVLDLAIELPLYQRNNLIIVNKKIIDENTLTPQNECTPYQDPLSKIWLVDFK